MNAIKTNTMDIYTVCLLAWFYGDALKEVMQFDGWTQENIDLAQKYCEEKHVDPVAYWMEE